jgi:hypothetical protein
LFTGSKSELKSAADGNSSIDLFYFVERGSIRGSPTWWFIADRVTYLEGRNRSNPGGSDLRGLKCY